MKDYTIGIIGLGYVGFPLACLFAKKYRTIGYDRNPLRIEEIYRGKTIPVNYLAIGFGSAWLQTWCARRTKMRWLSVMYMWWEFRLP